MAPILNHAYLHLDKILFKCRQCDGEFSTKSSIQAHLRNKHGLGSRKNFTDLSGNYQDEIVDMVKKCFQTSEASRPPRTERKVSLM